MIFNHFSKSALGFSKKSGAQTVAARQGVAEEKNFGREEGKGLSIISYV